MNYQNLPYLLALIVVCVGLYSVVCKKNLIKIVVGIIILDYGANLFLILTGYRAGNGDTPIAPILTDKNSEFFAARSVDPVPQALILTSIVIGLGLVALMAALAIRIHEKYGTFDISEIKNLKG